MLRHYIATVMPDGFKAMIVATSREACLRYHTALTTARDELVAELDQNAGSLDGTGKPLDPGESFLRAAAARIDLISALDFASVISGDHNDPLHYAPWTDKQAQQSRIDRFKLPLGSADDGKHSPLALLIVKSMLLTGFDVPQAQAIYLDRMIQEAELLQAVARVNRTAPRKTYGLVVDYYGVSAQLTQALAAYTSDDGQIDPDVDGALRPLTAEIDKLEPQRERIRQVFVQQGVSPAANEDSIDACVELLADTKLRSEFDVALRLFLSTFDTVRVPQRVTSLRSACSIAITGELSRAFVYAPGPAKPSKNVIPVSRNRLAMMGNHADMYRRSSVCFAAVWGSRSQRIPVGTATGLRRGLFRELVPHFALQFSTTGLGGSASPLLEEERDAR